MQWHLLSNNLLQLWMLPEPFHLSREDVVNCTMNLDIHIEYLLMDNLTVGNEPLHSCKDVLLRCLNHLLFHRSIRVLCDSLCRSIVNVRKYITDASSDCFQVSLRSHGVHSCSDSTAIRVSSDNDELGSQVRYCILCRPDEAALATCNGVASRAKHKEVTWTHIEENLNRSARISAAENSRNRILTALGQLHQDKVNLMAVAAAPLLRVKPLISRNKHSHCFLGWHRLRRCCSNNVSRRQSLEQLCLGWVFTEHLNPTRCSIKVATVQV
mmetsp:Transcript_54464/g.100706  ORF Transcript_54464/g.100706 Transcript_54464/m.100706 type:complete len:269 (-) Transcript_54464:846-1652(-)